MQTTSTSPATALVRDPKVLAFLEVIAFAEGSDYDTVVFGVVIAAPRFPHLIGQRNVRVPEFSNHPDILVRVNSTLRSTAAGRYQFLTSTWQGLRLPNFEPSNQDLGAVELMRGRGMIAPLLRGDVRGTIFAGVQEWASLPTPNGNSHYGGQPAKRLDELLARYAAALRSGTRSSPNASRPATAFASFDGRFAAAPSLAEVRSGTALRIGHRGESVGIVQDRLIEAGFLERAAVGNDRGYFGSRTRAAVDAFQRARGLLPPSGREGEIGPTTLMWLDGAGQVRAAASEPRGARATRAPGGSSPDVSNGAVLRVGATGPGVERLQRELVRVGYLTRAQMDTGPGIFGPQTEAAVRALQSDNGLIPPPGFEGAVGSTTWDVLLRSADGSASAGLVFPVDVPYQGPGRLQSYGAPRDGGARLHAGLDFTPPIPIQPQHRTFPIFAYQAGVVIEGNRVGYLGLQHDDGSRSRYVHNSRHVVAVGARVRAGEIVAYMGETGASAPHLHFEFYDPRGQALDPAALLLGPDNNPRSGLTVRAHATHGRPRSVGSGL